MKFTLRIALLLVLMLLAVNAYAVPINLGTASTFGLLGGSGVTNTGSSVISGDVGSAPTPAVTGFPPGIVIGTLYTTANAVTAQAQLRHTLLRRGRRAHLHMTSPESIWARSMRGTPLLRESTAFHHPRG